MGDALTLGAEDYRKIPQEVRIGSFSYMEGHPEFDQGVKPRLVAAALARFRKEPVRLFSVPYRPYVFRVDALVHTGNAAGLVETTPTPNLYVMDGHATRYSNEVWFFADGIPVVEGVRAWNQEFPEKRIGLVMACLDEAIDSTRVDFAPFDVADAVMSVYAGPAQGGFGLTDDGQTLGFMNFDQFPELPKYVSNLPTFTIR